VEAVIYQNEPFKEVWSQFINSDEIDKNNLREIIYKSWQRCKEYGIDPYDGLGKKRNKKLLERIIKKNEDLIEIARPFMNQLAELVKNSNFAVVLTDSQGIIMEFAGDQEITDRALRLNFFPGAYWSEEKVGTNAIGTAIKIDQPLQVIGAEHYCQKHHIWTCSAAPIHNQNGDLIGVLDMSGKCEDAHLHTLGMVVSAAKSIENQISLIEKNRELKKANNFSKAVFNSISEGLISINKFGEIILINQAASRMLGVERNQVIGNDIKETLGLQKPLEKMLNDHKVFNDVEISIHKDEKKIYLNLSTRLLLSHSGGIDGFILILRKMKSVKKMVNQITGSQAKFKFNDIIGEDQKIKEVIEVGKMISDSQAAVLIEGESGTGKEMIAQAIHNYSNRREQVFFSINCAAIPQSLLESELFGYEGGSFTGASKKGRPGKFELASGGTLLLDEIGEMPLNMQASLLRVLQEKKINRIGGREPVDVDVRILASTNRDLEKEVENGNFRKDLFFRLNTVTIKIPSLRERLGDIDKLVRHFIFVLNKRSNKKIHAVENSFIERLKAYNWPGNVRELENIIERAALLSEDGVITVEQLPTDLKKKNRNFIDENQINLNEFPTLALEEIETIMLKKTLDESSTLTEAAKILGVSRSTFYRKLKKYNIDR
jgi:PAS domain S-box-containing protein